MLKWLILYKWNFWGQIETVAYLHTMYGMGRGKRKLTREIYRDQFLMTIIVDFSGRFLTIKIFVVKIVTVRTVNFFTVTINLIGKKSYKNYNFRYFNFFWKFLKKNRFKKNQTNKISFNYKLEKSFKIL